MTLPTNPEGAQWYKCSRADYCHCRDDSTTPPLYCPWWEGPKTAPATRTNPEGAKLVEEARGWADLSNDPSARHHVYRLADALETALSAPSPVGGAELLKEVADLFANIDEVASVQVGDGAIVDITYCHNHGKKYGIVSTTMGRIRRIAKAIALIRSERI